MKQNGRSPLQVSSDRHFKLCQTTSLFTSPPWRWKSWDLWPLRGSLRAAMLPWASLICRTCWDRKEISVGGDNHTRLQFLQGDSQMGRYIRFSVLVFTHLRRLVNQRLWILASLGNEAFVGFTWHIYIHVPSVRLKWLVKETIVGEIRGVTCLKCVESSYPSFSLCQCQHQCELLGFLSPARDHKVHESVVTLK